MFSELTQYMGDFSKARSSNLTHPFQNSHPALVLSWLFVHIHSRVSVWIRL